MEIYFKSKKLQKICSSHRLLKKHYGNKAGVIMQRLTDLAACENLQEVMYLPGKHHPLTQNLAGKFACRLTGNDRLIYQPACDPLPVDAQNSLMYDKIVSIVIIKIEDYH